MNDLPEPTEGQFVSRILSNQSGSSFEIEIPAKEVTFSVEDNARSEDGFIKGVARLPAKFKNLIFVKRGSLVIVEPISHSFVGAGALSKNKITHEIVHILSEDHVRNLVKKQLFPECFVSESVRKMMDHASQVDEFNFLKNTHPLDDEDDDMIGLGNVSIVFQSFFLLFLLSSISIICFLSSRMF